jgi:phage N-6-adenine-methyltransferase
MSKRHQLVGQAIEGPQLRTRLDIPPVDLRSPLIRQIVLEGQECQARIRRFRREGLVAWLEQANRLDIIHNVHNIVGTAFEKLAEEIGFDASTAYGLLQLRPFAARLLDECDKLAAADPKYRYPGWRTALAMMKGESPESSQRPQTLADAMRHIEQLSAEKAELEIRLSKAKYGKMGRGDQERATPQWLYDHFDKEFHFTFDAAASEKNHKHPHFFTKEQNALEQEWSGVIWLNPPWNEIGPFMKKAYESAQRGASVVCLVPLWSTERWFPEYALHGHIRILSDRVAFEGYDQKAPQPLCVIVFKKRSRLRADGRMHVTYEHIQAPGNPKRKDNVPSMMSRGFAVS